MCGIVGYTGKRAAQEIILAGLEKLEYRGYDSAGISLVEDDGLEAVRAVGNLSRLRAAVEARSRRGRDGGVAVATRPADTGVGHTRWATHGRVTEENAHPHFDTQDRVHVVVNGIVENYLELKQELVAEGAVFTSETDAEVIAHLIAKHLDEGDLEQAVRIAYGSSAATTPSSRSPPRSPTRSSPPARSARSWSAAATASSSSPPRSRPSWSTRATCS